MAAGRRDGRDLVLEVRVQPRASRSEIGGTLGDRLRVRLQAPPVDGRANAALVEFLAETFDVPRAAVTIERGLTGRDKRVRIHGVGPLAARMSALIGCD
jgi:uncharacterized protein (TIGR00251 family)